MSVSILKLIPGDPALVPSRDDADQALLACRRHIPVADEIEAEFLAGVQFVDQGSNFESVSCPNCEAELDLAWWQERMDAAWLDGQGRFGDLHVVMPCCAASSSLNDLVYESTAGFASFVLKATNPERGARLPDDELADIATALGSPLRQVTAHY